LKNRKIQPQFSAKTAGTTLEILIYAEIGIDWWTGEGVTPIDVAAAVKAAGEFDTIVLRINSPGGNCFDGVTIHNLLRSLGKPITVFVDGMAASAASVIAMAGDTINIGQGAMLMVHNAMWGVFGDARALRKGADDIENISITVGAIYVARTGLDADAIKAIMDAETWLSGEQAVEQGFADAVVTVDEGRAAQAKQLAAQFSMKGFKHVPAELRARKGPRNESINPNCECPCAACQEDGCAGCENDPCTEPGCDCPNHEEEMSADDGPSLEMLGLRLKLHEHSL
jgi:ATP-dependent Clp protease protease subunit